MRIGQLIGVPDAYTQYARIKDEDGLPFTVEPGEVPKGAKLGDNFAYKVDIWTNDSGLAYGLREDG